MAGFFDKGLEFSSTAGRLTYWGDLARLLVEYPLTGRISAPRSGRPEVRGR